jgi:uncharacterized protein YraI
MRNRLIYLIVSILMLFGVPPLWAQAPQPVLQPLWQAYYFNNPYLLDPVVFQRQDSNIGFDWGTGSPGANIANDNFSVRWITDMSLAQGTYRFYVMADDEVKVLVDDKPVIDTFGNPRVGQVVSQDATLDAGTHRIQVDYREFGGGASVFFSFETLSDGAQGPLFITQPTPVQPTQNAWVAEYFSNGSLAGSPAVIHQVADPSFHWGNGSPATGIPADNWSARWSRTINVTGGTYRVNVSADDGVRVFVDGVLVINEWHTYRDATYAADVNLSNGLHTVVIEFSEQSGVAFLNYSLVLATSAPPPVASSTWTAEYFNNRVLAGSPVIVQQEASPSHDWGTGSPDSRLALDSWSIRWTRTISVSGGSYNIRAKVDDGLRVYVDNTLVMNEWHISTSEVHSENVTLSAGLHTVVVEYYEQGGAAYLDFNMSGPGLDTSAPAPVPPSDGAATATINTGRLNVRSEPSVSGAIVTRVSRGQSFPVVATNADRSWVQLNVNGIVGWVNVRYVRLNNAGNVPAPNNPAPPAATGYTLIATPFTVNIRSGPGSRFDDIGNLRVDQQAQVVGRNAANTWWQINYSGIVGWVSTVYTRVDPAPDVNSIPITG